MITLTEVAAVQLQTLLQEQDLSDHGLRVFVQGGGCAGLQYGMAYEDTAREDDTLVEEHGVRLFIDAFSAQYLKGALIDFEESPMGGGFRIDNPNVTNSCACGSSFCSEGDGEGGEACC